MNAIRLVGWTILAVLVFALPNEVAGTPKASPSPKVRVDLHGDPLPKGAIARLGSLRFRHPGQVQTVAFSPNGKLLAASSYDNAVILWERATGRKLRAFAVDAGWAPPRHLRFSADSKRLYGLHWHRRYTLYIWETATGAEEKVEQRLPSQALVRGFLQDGQELIFLQKEEIVRWDIAKGKERCVYDAETGRQVGKPIQTGAWRIALSADGRLLATCAWQKGVRL